MTKTAAIAISGGIDSLYAAHLLIESGYKVKGIHFVTEYDRAIPLPYSTEKSDKVISHCKCSEATTSAMSHVAEQLGIQIDIIDCNDIFQQKVVDYFIEGYRVGKTPSPCLACNPIIKFGALLEFAKKTGADFLATGHYVQTDIDKNGICHLYKGIDKKKDQSYFLGLLNQEQLKSAKFPLGDKTKSEIVKHAKEAGLSPVSTKESQDICFIKDNDYKKFLLGTPEFRVKPGKIIDTSGKEIGRHTGLHSFTIGQRRGINCPGPAPYYVIKLDMKTDSLTVGFKEDLLASSCRVHDINWIIKPNESKIRLTTHIRYRHNGADSTLELTDNNTGIINFTEPVSAITPGQGAVFYSGSEVLGAGWIE